MAIAITPQMKNFMDEWSQIGGPVAQSFDLPVSAMVACASIESAWGTGAIFRQTLSPFSLQKWPHVIHPTTNKIFWQVTVVNAATGKTMKAPFVCSTDRADAVRQWCEWILHWGDADGPPGNPDPKAPRVASQPGIADRNKILKVRKDGFAFAGLLPIVGFGEKRSNPAYANRVRDFSMDQFD